MDTMNFPSNLQIFRENVDFVISKIIACRVNSEIRVFFFPNTHTRFLYCFIHFSSHLAKLQTLKVSGEKLFR